MVVYWFGWLVVFLLVLLCFGLVWDFFASQQVQWKLFFWQCQVFGRWTVNILPVNFLTFGSFVKCTFPVSVFPYVFFPFWAQACSHFMLPKADKTHFSGLHQHYAAAKGLIIKSCKMSFFTLCNPQDSPRWEEDNWLQNESHSVWWDKPRSKLKKLIMCLLKANLTVLQNPWFRCTYTAINSPQVKNKPNQKTNQNHWVFRSEFNCCHYYHIYPIYHKFWKNVLYHGATATVP